MDLRPPRILAVVMGLAALLAAGFAAWAATAGPVGVAVAVGLGAIAASAGALGVVMWRHVRVGNGVVAVGAPRAVTFSMDDLQGPLRLGLFGVRLTDGRRTRLVLAQLPALSSQLVGRLPDHAPNLREPDDYPIVIRGRISTPVAYGVVAAIGVAMGLIGLTTGSGWFQRGLAGAFLVAGAAALFWVLRRAERRVEITADQIVRRHLLGARRTPRGRLAAAVVVTGPRSLPRSTLERDVHVLRLVEDDGRTIDVAPGLAAFPDYGSDGERRLARHRAWQLTHLAGRPTTVAEVHEGGGVELALWHHDERSPGALPVAVVFRRPVGGCQVVGVLDGDVAVGDHPPRVLIRHWPSTLIVIDTTTDTVAHHELDDAVVGLDPGFGRVVLRSRDRVDRPCALAELDAGRPGWPPGGPVIPPTPTMPWYDDLAAVLAAAPLDDDATWALLATRCFADLGRLHAGAGWLSALDALVASLDEHDR